jgi:vacuolar-type H+-ATPase subunit F/Vma7
MITLIGTSTTTIGFGLCGINDIHEVERITPVEEILKIIQETENNIIMIDEEINNLIKHKTKRTNKFIIEIPFRYKKVEEIKNIADDIDELVKDSLGFATKKN